VENILFYIVVSAFLLFIGISGIIGAFKLDRKSQNSMSKDPYSSIFILMPLGLAKVVLFLLSLFPIVIVLAMWLQEYGVIE